MIIQVRGTSGSGKSTVMKKVMGLMGDWQARHQAGRKRPLYYVSQSEWPTTLLLGHYEIDCGGCDTLGSAPDAYNLTVQVLADRPGAHVLSEGLLLSEDVKWTLALRDAGHDVRPIFLRCTVDECLAKVKVRQEQKGRPPADPERVVMKLTRRVETIGRARDRLLQAGVQCPLVFPNHAPSLILNWLRSASCPSSV